MTGNPSSTMAPSTGSADHVFGGDPTLSKGWTTPQIDYATLICIGTIGVIGNVLIMVLILIVPGLRKSANALVFHHCVLDLLKALYCGIFANSLLRGRPPLYCNLLGGSFIVCVTSTAFNLLAMVMNEAYVFADLNNGVQDTANYCCVVFSISTIWFASIILNLGVAFLPGNPSYIEGVGHCTFIYGLIRNYVLHVLWIILVTLAVSLTSMYLKRLYFDIKNSHYIRLTRLVRQSIPRESGSELVDTAGEEVDEEALMKQVERYGLRKFYTLLLMLAVFIIFYYPLFMLTIVDRSFGAPPSAYKVLTIFACSNASLNPFIFICLIKRRCCCHADAPAMPSYGRSGKKSSKSKKQQKQSGQGLAIGLMDLPPPPESRIPERLAVQDNSSGGFQNDHFFDIGPDELRDDDQCSADQTSSRLSSEDEAIAKTATVNTCRRVSYRSARALWSSNSRTCNI